MAVRAGEGGTETATPQPASHAAYVSLVSHPLDDERQPSSAQCLLHCVIPGSSHQKRRRARA
jgi:hypothetical protein